MDENISITKYLPFIFVLILTTVLYFIHLAFHLLPLLQIGITKAFKVESKYKEDAGRIPVTEEWRNTPDPKLIYERKDDGRLRFCKYELVYKPDRAHYCRQLKRNVLRMDHYCPWFGNCIGHYNYKYFFLALLYGCISLFYMIFNQVNTLTNIWSDINVTFGHLYLVSLGTCFCGVLIIIVVPFFLFHVYITSRNETTIEFCEKRSKEKNFTYDQGIYKNFQSVFGTNPLLWLLPVGLPPSDGLFFPVRKIDTTKQI